MLYITPDATIDRFLPQIAQISQLADIAVCDSAGLRITAQEGGDGLHVVKNADSAVITFQRKCEFFRGLLILLERGEEDFSLHESPFFDFNGEMIDNSRNAVIDLPAMKRLIIYHALLGLDHLLLYNEDTFEVTGQPYFGHMRMGYTKAELRELNDFGNEFGVTITPCIQTLAHLSQMLRWPVYHDICDHGDTMLVGEQKTYDLIDAVLQTWSECVDTKQIHIGMDEAYFLGRGQYADKNNYKTRYELMRLHLSRVLALCDKYGFQPMIWSDMFFPYYDYYGDNEADAAAVQSLPDNMTVIYWDYYSMTGEKYRRQFNKHEAFHCKVGYAGGAWRYNGLAPNPDHSHRVSQLALAQAKQHGVKTVFTTAWGDAGAMASIYTTLPCLCLFAEENYYSDDMDRRVSTKLELLTGYSLDEFFDMSLPNRLKPEEDRCNINPSWYLLLQDPLMGLFDYHVEDFYPQHYRETSARLATLAGKDSRYSYLFDTLAKLCEVLESKCDIGVRLKLAYDSGDKNELARLADTVVPQIAERVERLYEAVRVQWYSESRSSGFDFVDIVFGTLKQRLSTTQRTVQEYLSGGRDSIAELAQPRLSFDGKEYPAGDRCLSAKFWNIICSPNMLGGYR